MHIQTPDQRLVWLKQSGRLERKVAWIKIHN